MLTILIKEDVTSTPLISSAFFITFLAASVSNIVPAILSKTPDTRLITSSTLIASSLVFPARPGATFNTTHSWHSHNIQKRNPKASVRLKLLIVGKPSSYANVHYTLSIGIKTKFIKSQINENLIRCLCRMPLISMSGEIKAKDLTQ